MASLVNKLCTAISLNPRYIKTTFLMQMLNTSSNRYIGLLWKPEMTAERENYSLKEKEGMNGQGKFHCAQHVNEDSGAQRT